MPQIFDFFKMLGKEQTISDYVPFSSTVDDSGVVMCRNGELLASWRIKGAAFETLNEDEIELQNDAFNSALKIIGTTSSEYAVQVHRIRRKIKDSLTPAKKAGVFIDDLTQKYNEYVGSQTLYTTELYITLIFKSRRIAKAARSLQQIKYDNSTRLEEFLKICAQLERSLNDFYKPKRLSVYKKDNVKFSEQLSFYNFLISGIWQEIRLSEAPLYNILGNVQLFVGSDIMQLQNTDIKRFIQSIEFKGFCSETYPGILNSLLYPTDGLSYEFIESQSFAMIGKREALSFLNKQKKQLISSNDAGISQIEMLTLAEDQVVDEAIVFGEYCYNLLIIGENEQQCRLNTHDAFTKLGQAGYTPFISTLALTASYASNLPSNFRWRPRIAKIASKNFTEQAPLHNFPCGKRTGNPWGEAVALLKTVSEQPYYFNFHVSSDNKDNYKDLLAGHTMILGMTGAGKTVTMNFLLSMAQKYRDDTNQKMNTVFFDKDFGAEICIRAMGGQYLNLRAGEPTGFNPFQIDDSPENREFLVKFLKLLIDRTGTTVSAFEEDQLVRAVSAVMVIPKEHRRLGLIPQNLTDGTTKSERENSLSLRLKRWVGNGDLAWVFDKSNDFLDFNKCSVSGIDGTNILNNKDIAAPIIAYLLYRLNDIKDGRKLLIALDEVWQWLDDNLSQQFVKDMLKTGRKQNVTLVMATQSPSDFIQSPIAPAIIEQSVTQIFLPNTNGSPEEYIDKFKCTNVEFNVITSLSQTSRKFLVKQDRKSTLCHLDLSALKNELKVLSGTTEGSEKLQEIRQDLYTRGIDPNIPDNWLNLYYEAMK